MICVSNTEGGKSVYVRGGNNGIVKNMAHRDLVLLYGFEEHDWLEFRQNDDWYAIPE